MKALYFLYRQAGCPASLAIRFARLDARGYYRQIPAGWFLRAHCYRYTDSTPKLP